MKESFLKFRNKVARFAKLSRNQVGILAPIMYAFNDKYYFAVEKFLDNGEETDLCFDEYSIKKIMTSMGCSYLEALIILNNMEKIPEYACYIYNPRITE